MRGADAGTTDAGSAAAASRDASVRTASKPRTFLEIMGKIEANCNGIIGDDRVHLRVVAGESGMGILPMLGGSPQAHGRDARATSEREPPATIRRCTRDDPVNRLGWRSIDMFEEGCWRRFTSFGRKSRA